MRRLPFTLSGLLVLLPFGMQAETPLPLGILYVGEKSTLELPFHNDGFVAVQVERAETSCDCLVPQFTVTEVPAGETRLLTFTYRSTVIGRMRVDIEYFGASAVTMLRQSSVAGTVIERTWVATAEQVRNLEQIGEMVMIDLRSAERFEQVRVPRSLNVPAFALKLRPDLMSKKLVLIDGGFSPVSLAEEAQRLRESGFREVYVFDGGVAAWIRQGGPVEGGSRSAVAAARITPAEFLRSQAKEPWRLVESESAAARLLAETDSAIQPGRISARILIVDTESGAGYPALEKHGGALSAAPLFYLTGGTKALATYEAEQRQMAANPGAVFQSTSLQPHAVATSGCGTCPK